MSKWNRNIGIAFSLLAACPSFVVYVLCLSSKDRSLVSLESVMLFGILCALLSIAYFIADLRCGEANVQKQLGEETARKLSEP